jgi:hypothetical protein
MTDKEESANWHCEYTLEKRLGDIDECETPEERLQFLKDTRPFEIINGKDNCLLNSGINEIWDLVTGAVVQSGHIFDNGHAQIGVGESTTAANSSQIDLQGSSKTYKGMETSYPTSTAQKVTLKSSFGSSDANYAWNEWVSKQSTSAVCLNRKVESMGTKSSGSTWTLEVTITLS